jgi:hypothetical protein
LNARHFAAASVPVGVLRGMKREMATTMSPMPTSVTIGRKIIGAISPNVPMATQPPNIATISAKMPIDFQRPRV